MSFGITSILSATTQEKANEQENRIQTVSSYINKLLKESKQKHIGLRKSCQEVEGIFTYWSTCIILIYQNRPNTAIQ